MFTAPVAYPFPVWMRWGDELQEPFSTELNALSLSAMTRRIEVSMLEAVGETSMPEPATAFGSILR